MEFSEMQNTVIQGDCLEIMKSIPDKSIDFIITSPPYKNAYEGIGINRGTKTAKYHYNNDVGEPLYLILDVSKELLRITKDNGILFLNWGFNSDSGAMRPFYIVEKLLKQGWFCPQRIIWHKLNPIPNTANQLTNSFEEIFILTKKPTYKLKTISREYIHNVWNIAVECGETEHNAAFPIEIPQKIIEVFSDKNDLILDCFLGSGTTALACIKANRKFIGIEISPEYCKIANDRIAAEISQQKIF